MWDNMSNSSLKERLMENMSVNALNHLEISNTDTTKLAEKYGTPLYVYDLSLIKKRIQSFKDAFSKYENKTQVAYASKAFSSLALYEILADEDVSLDVVSGGELFLALKAGFPAERIHFHGNNKSYQELTEAIEHSIGCIVVDNFTELSMLDEITRQLSAKVDVLIRVTPGIEAHTHEYITTGQEDSKFGFNLSSGQVERAIETLQESPYINVIGLHAHIGSQIFEVEGYKAVIGKLMEKADEWKSIYDFDLKVLNVGGGFGIRYTQEDKPLPLEVYAEAIMTAVKKEADQFDLTLPEIWIEPGRSIVGEAGTTLYSIGTEKAIPDVRKYISIDGGMADNIRPALYQAKYTGVLANKVIEDHLETVSVAGKACESGDMLIWDITLPQATAQDILAVFSTGAYGYSMASNYNRLPRPAVVFVENGHDWLAIKRESYQDFLNLEVSSK
ncbi:diaminopimelate decarboxylase [Alkalibacterium olivapovliticus]|uniref:Diaminopimelate decarboxylase n=2 Tax=Alkalibacterium olivapovliticus TaxID=99907 RepID=A0A2T0W0X8_9LACT|nr:diaminopimelate decarboxylase [Alkalibacterium olivapovliticus]